MEWSQNRASPKIRAIGVLLLAHLACGAAWAQSRAATPFLPADHWGRAAVVRLVALEALDAEAAARAWPASRGELAAWLATAERRATERNDVFAIRLAGGFRKRLALEFDSVTTLQVRLGPGVLFESGALRAGTMAGNDTIGWHYPGPHALASERTALVEAEVGLRVSRAAAVGVEVDRDADRTDVGAAYLAMRYRALDVWAGRRSVSLGSAAESGIVLNAARLDGVGLSLRDGIRLGFLGVMRADATLARTERSGKVRHPYFHAARLSFTPSAELAIGLNRALLFGGEGNESITLTRIALALIGFSDTRSKDSDFENQVASVDVLWRVGGPADVQFYGEFGVDDTGFAFAHVPGIILGAGLARVPGFNALQLGVELVHLQKSCCGYPPWYQHIGLGDGWTDRGRLLGHPLGGAGSEAALNWRIDLATRGVIAAGGFFMRRRGAENLFAPVREGESYGGSVDLRLLLNRIDFTVSAGGELGRQSWSAGRVQAKAAVRL